MDEEEGGIINADYASSTEHVDDISTYQESLENQTNGALTQFINRTENNIQFTADTEGPIGEVNIHFRNTGISEDYVIENVHITHAANDSSQQMSDCAFTLHMGGAADYLLKMNILIYLNARELCILSLTSRYMNNICQSPFLWSSLYFRDFIHDDEQNDNNTANNNNSAFYSLYSLLASNNSSNNQSNNM